MLFEPKDTTKSVPLRAGAETRRPRGRTCLKVHHLNYGTLKIPCLELVRRQGAKQRRPLKRVSMAKGHKEASGRSMIGMDDLLKRT